MQAMLAASRKTDLLRVVADQRGCPTSANDLAAAILMVLARINVDWRRSYRGIFHAAGSGDATWYDFAEAIFAGAARYGWRAPTIVPITTAEWPTAALRPADSRLDCGKLAATFGIQMPMWHLSLRRTIDEIRRKPSSSTPVAL